MSARRVSDTRRASRVSRLAGFILAGTAMASLASLPSHAANLPTSSSGLASVSQATTVPTTTCSVDAAADTYASSLLAPSNFGGETTLRVRSDLLDNRRSFVRFDIGSCSGISSAEIKSATLRLRLSVAPPTSRTYAAHRITAAWTETGLTWNNQPAVGASPTSSAATGTTSNVTLAWDVTADVAAFVAGTATNNGWRVNDQTESALAAAEGTFSSREAASGRPELEIVYHP